MNNKSIKILFILLLLVCTSACSNQTKKEVKDKEPKKTEKEETKKEVFNIKGDWKKAYKEQLDQMQGEYYDEEASETISHDHYLLVDIDKNSVPELFVHDDAYSPRNIIYKIYTFDNNRVLELGSITGTNFEFYTTDKDYFYQYFFMQGVNMISKYYIDPKQKTIEKEEIVSCYEFDENGNNVDCNYILDEVKPYENNQPQNHSIDDYSAIDEYQS